MDHAALASSAIRARGELTGRRAVRMYCNACDLRYAHLPRTKMRPAIFQVRDCGIGAPHTGRAWGNGAARMPE